jgi:5-formyltetrahydrofolate cyclo-ligase
MQPSQRLTKNGLRRRMTEERSALSLVRHRDMSNGVLANLRAVPLWSTLQEVLLYAPVRNEVDTWPLLEELWGRGVRVLLPRCRRCAPGEMEWAPATCRGDLTPGMHSIPEPDPATCRPAEPHRSDLVLLPGVAFDRLGYRLGYGGGFYDRFLSLPALSRTTTIGLAFSFQVVDLLPREPWDIPVQMVVTELEVLCPNR